MYQTAAAEETFCTVMVPMVKVGKGNWAPWWLSALRAHAISVIYKAPPLKTVTSAQAEGVHLFVPEHLAAGLPFYSHVRRSSPICNPAAVKKVTHMITSVWVCFQVKFL